MVQQTFLYQTLTLLSLQIAFLPFEVPGPTSLSLIQNDTYTVLRTFHAYANSHAYILKLDFLLLICLMPF